MDNRDGSLLIIKYTTRKKERKKERLIEWSSPERYIL